LVRRYGRLIHLNESHLERARTFFDRHGPKTVFLGRFIALLRSWAAVLAGAARMPYGTFMLYNALGAVCWSLVAGALGYLFGHNLPQLQHYIGQAGLAAALLVALVVGLVLGWRWFERRHPRARAFVAARFARGEYLGLHLTVGLATSLAGLWLFAAITEDVIHHDPLTQFDVMLLDWLHAHATPAGYTIFSAISFLGSSVVMTVLGLGVALRLSVRRRWIVLGGWVAAFAGGGLLNQILKLTIQRPRPPYAAQFLQHFSWSFPSGHAMASLIGYGMLAYLLMVHGTNRRSMQTAIVLGAALLIVAIGASRLYLGVHYFSDVVGGYAAGVLWLAACVSGLEVARRWEGSSVRPLG
jgi:undecaprenyl-diphosphatase